MKVAMVVDDEPLLRRQVSEIVAEYGFDEIVEAGDGDEAVAVAEVKKALLIVMGVSMSGIDGVTAAEKTGKTLSSPIVMLTGTGDPETIERARLAGVMNYVMKPINLGKLYAAIDLAIHQYVEVSSLRDVVVKLKDSLETRKLVDRGKALLMKQGLSEPQAYRKMQQVAMDKLKSMKEVAEAILLMSN